VASEIRARAARVPEWVWLAGLVVVSAVVRIVLSRQMLSPFVFVDELIYSELGRSLADGEGYEVREAPVSGYSLLYPALIAPAYALFDDLPAAYAMAKAIGAVTMSFAALPAYLLARRVVGRWVALLAAAIAVAIPSMAYTGTITTESLFYPVSLGVALVLVRYLARPTTGRLLALAVGLAIAFATRSQALAFLPAVATAPLLLAAFRARRAELRPFVPLYGLLAGGTVLLVALQALRGQSLSELLGAYAVVGEGGYDAGDVMRFWLWHVEELTLYACVVPMVVLAILLSRVRRLPDALQEHLAATVALGFWSTLVVGAFASRFASDRIQDRYLFFLVPLLMVALVAWGELGAPRPPAITASAAAGALVLTAVFPYARFIGEPAKSDSLGLIPLWTANEYLVAGSYWATAVLSGAVVLAVSLALVRRHAILVPAVLLVLLVALSRPVWSGPHGFVAAAVGALRQGNPGLERDWIDRATADGSEVVALWTGQADRFTVNVNEFFNRRVGRVLYTGAPTPGGINELPVARASADGFPAGREGVFYLPNDATVVAPYALLDGTVTPDGERVSRNELVGTVLWRLDGPLASLATIEGLYPGDSWSGRAVTWRLLRCDGGELRVQLHSDPTLFAGRLTRVVATVDGRPAAGIAVPPEGSVSLRVPLVSTRRVCAVAFSVTPTLIPAEVLPGATDERALGVHFDSFVHEEPA